MRIAVQVQKPKLPSDKADRCHVYALDGQAIHPDRSIQFPINKRILGAFYIVDVASSAGSTRRTFPFLTNGKTQAVVGVTQEQAYQFVRTQKALAASN